MTHSPFRPLLVAALLVAAAACDRSSRSSKELRPAPKRGVVGQVERVQGTVTWRASKSGPETPLRPGDPVRAEWTVRTGPRGALAVRMRNGHLWQVGPNVTQRVGTALALRLPPLRRSALGTLSDLGTDPAQRRTSAAGRVQERSAGSPASATHPSELEKSPRAAPPAEPAPTAAPADTATRAPTASAPPPKAERKPRRPSRTVLRNALRAGGGRQLRDLAGSGSGVRGGAAGGRGVRSDENTRKPLNEARPPRPPAPPAGPRPSTKGAPRRARLWPLQEAIAEARRRIAAQRHLLQRCLQRHKVRTAVLVGLTVQAQTGRVLRSSVRTRPAIPTAARTCLALLLRRIPLPATAKTYGVLVRLPRP